MRHLERIDPRRRVPSRYIRVDVTQYKFYAQPFALQDNYVASGPSAMIYRRYPRSRDLFSNFTTGNNINNAP